jgi:hypothetical protein
MAYDSAGEKVARTAGLRAALLAEPKAGNSVGETAASWAVLTADVKVVATAVMRVVMMVAM